MLRCDKCYDRSPLILFSLIDLCMNPCLLYQCAADRCALFGRKCPRTFCHHRACAADDVGHVIVVVRQDKLVRNPFGGSRWLNDRQGFSEKGTVTIAARCSCNEGRRDVVHARTQAINVIKG